MGEAKFTPGPWWFIPSGALISGADRKPCVLTWSGSKGEWLTCGPEGLLAPLDDHPANKHLIETSPRLYRVLEQAVSVFENSPNACDGPCECAECQTLADMRAALAMARGEVAA